MSHQRAKSKGRKRIVRKAGLAPGRGGTVPDLNAASRALLGPDPEQRPYRPQREDASVEDPLEDWPD